MSVNRLIDYPCTIYDNHKSEKLPEISFVSISAENSMFVSKTCEFLDSEEQILTFCKLLTYAIQPLYFNKLKIAHVLILDI